MKASFMTQTCWIKTDNRMPNIHNSKLYKNYLCITSLSKTVKLFNIFYKLNF